jgi:hypothetical protein
MMIRKKWDKRGLLDPAEFEEYVSHDAPDPLLLTIRRLCAEPDRRKRCDPPSSQTPDDQALPPGTIQACQARSAGMGRA